MQLHICVRKNCLSHESLFCEERGQVELNNVKNKSTSFKITNFKTQVYTKTKKKMRNETRADFQFLLRKHFHLRLI